MYDNDTLEISYIKNSYSFSTSPGAQPCTTAECLLDVVCDAQFIILENYDNCVNNGLRGICAAVETTTATVTVSAGGAATSSMAGAASSSAAAAASSITTTTSFPTTTTSNNQLSTTMSNDAVVVAVMTEVSIALMSCCIFVAALL